MANDLRENSRRDLLRLLPKNCVCAEIGVWKGEFSRSILEIIQPRMLHLVDPWLFDSNQPYTWYGGKAARGQADMDSIYNDVVREFGSLPNVTIYRTTSEKAAALFRNTPFGFVYIDADHSYDHVLADLERWFPKIWPGGIICGDDFNTRHGRTGDFEVRRAAVTFADRHQLRFRAVYEDQYAIQVRPAEATAAQSDAPPPAAQRGIESN